MPINLLISYSHKDKDMLEKLEEHLAMLKRDGTIKAWCDRDIDAGQKLDPIIEEALGSASIFLFLVSSSFLNSDYAYKIEMERATKRESNGENVVIIPIILRFCEWQKSPLSQFKALPEDGTPIKAWGDVDKAYLDVVRGIRRVAEKFDNSATANITSSKGSATVEDAKNSTQKPLKQDYKTGEMRIKKEFTDLDRYNFRKEAFDQVVMLFQVKLRELETENSEVKTDLDLSSSDRFSCVAYVSGNIKSEITIWLNNSSRESIGDIACNFERTQMSTSINGAVSIKDDGYDLFFEATLNPNFIGDVESRLDGEGVANLFWKSFFDRLQQ